jgi:hypothetical protein
MKFVLTERERFVGGLEAVPPEIRCYFGKLSQDLHSMQFSQKPLLARLLMKFCNLSVGT